MLTLEMIVDSGLLCFKKITFLEKVLLVQSTLHNALKALKMMHSNTLLRGFGNE